MLAALFALKLSLSKNHSVVYSLSCAPWCNSSFGVWFWVFFSLSWALLIQTQLGCLPVETCPFLSSSLRFYKSLFYISSRKCLIFFSLSLIIFQFPVQASRGLEQKTRSLLLWEPWTDGYSDFMTKHCAWSRRNTCSFITSCKTP